MTVLAGRGVTIGSAWRCAIFQVPSSRRKMYGGPQRERSHVSVTCEPRLDMLNLDDVAQVRSAVSGHLLETAYGPVANLGGCVRCRLGDFGRSAARRAKRIRERDVVAPRVELHRWIWIAIQERHLSLSERLHCVVEAALGSARFLTSPVWAHG
jgi:hypothetical protein